MNYTYILFLFSVINTRVLFCELLRKLKQISPQVVSFSFTALQIKTNGVFSYQVTVFNSLNRINNKKNSDLANSFYLFMGINKITALKKFIV